MLGYTEVFGILMRTDHYMEKVMELKKIWIKNKIEREAWDYSFKNYLEHHLHNWVYGE